MIKKILLKLANRIYKHYNKSIEIHRNDIIKFENGYFRMVSSVLRRELCNVDTLELELHDITESLHIK